MELCMGQQQLGPVVPLNDDDWEEIEDAGGTPRRGPPRVAPGSGLIAMQSLAAIEADIVSRRPASAYSVQELDLPMFGGDRLRGLDAWSEPDGGEMPATASETPEAGARSGSPFRVALFAAMIAVAGIAIVL